MKRKISRIPHLTVESFLSKYSQQLYLTLLTTIPENGVNITEPTTNRPGLALCGFFQDFPQERIQVIGNSEMAYLRTLSPDALKSCLQSYCQFDIPCIIVTRNAEIPPLLLETASANSIPLLRTSMATMAFITQTTIILEKEFALTTTAHGCMLHVRGIGVLIKGKSGSGKSETAIGLVERGGSLIADDHVKIRNVAGELTAYTDNFCRGFIEMRGIGIVNVANIYGLGSIQPDSKLDIIINLRPHSDLNEVDRIGIDRKTENVLGVEVPYVDIPVAPGRDTARLVGVTILELQLRRLGYDMAEEFNMRLNEKINKSNN